MSVQKSRGAVRADPLPRLWVGLSTSAALLSIIG